MSLHLTAMIEAARTAGQGLLEDRSRLGSLSVSDKGAGDFVSPADLRAEDTIRSILPKCAPQYGVVGEEGGGPGHGDQLAWVVDPLDGTTNFLWGGPLFGVNVALVHNDDVLAGVTYLPALEEMYWAEQGKGAFL